MPRRTVTRLDRLNSYYWSMADIQQILRVSHEKAKRIYEYVAKEEEQEYEFRVHETRVEQIRVAKLLKLNMNLLRKQIESEEQNKKGFS